MRSLRRCRCIRSVLRSRSVMGSRSAWEYDVSGYKVLQQWLAYRMKNGAGRQTSTLDKIRPNRWTLSDTEELLELV